MYYKGVKFLVAGISRSGIAACRLLLKKGAKCYIFDDLESPEIEQSKSKLREEGAVPVKKSELMTLLPAMGALVLSPGIPIGNFLPVAAKKAGVRILGELELGSYFCRAPVIGVTGTNGKTTTVTMLCEILKESGFSPYALGNIGTPLCSAADTLTEEDVAVVEVSSFQLETVYSFKPHIAVVTNVTPDHLNRHYTMENYLYLKGRLLSNLRESEYAVLNADDDRVRSLAAGTRAKIVWFSDRGDAECSLKDGNICFFSRPVMRADELGVGGRHNVQNALAAVAAAKLLGADSECVRRALMNFRGVRHRIQFVRELDGVTYYNDSKGTNVDSTLKAIEAMTRPTVLILGGKDKGYDYDALFGALAGSRVVHAVITGETRIKMLDAASRAGFTAFTVCADFEKSVRIARMQCPEGGSVLFSPAASSFDLFSSYEERGDRFIEIVESLC